MRTLISIFILSLFLTSCNSNKEIKPSESAKVDYLQAKEMIDKEKYNKANMFLDKYGAKHPYSQYTVPAKLLRIYAAYKGDEFILSETLSEQFINQHPNHVQIDYAQYMFAMSHYKQVNKPAHDQTPTQRTIQAFNDLITKHPNSPYAKEAQNYLQQLYNYLATHELKVGLFYFNKKQMVAAVNRFQVILEKYQTSPAIEEALYTLAAAYHALGITQSARETTILLQHNYPQSPWSKKASIFL